MIYWDSCNVMENTTAYKFQEIPKRNCKRLKFNGRIPCTKLEPLDLETHNSNSYKDGKGNMSPSLASSSGDSPVKPCTLSNAKVVINLWYPSLNKLTISNSTYIFRFC